MGVFLHDLVSLMPKSGETELWAAWCCTSGPEWEPCSSWAGQLAEALP